MSKNVLSNLISLNALSIDGASFFRRYLEMSFSSVVHNEVQELVNELRLIDNNRIEDVETDTEGNISKLVVVSAGIERKYENFQAMFNAYFKLALKGELKDKHSLFLLAEKLEERDVIYNKFLDLQNWVSLFKDVTGNFIFKSNDNELSIVIVEELESDKKIKTRDLVIENHLVKQIFFNISPFPSIYDFGEDENYAVEKKLILKAALLKTFKRAKDKAVILKIIQNPNEFNDYYSTGYEFYTKKYAIDKFIREIETSKVEYFEKINLIIHDNQSKALSIPVVILGTSLLRSWNVMSAILIMTAMLLALYLVVLNLNHKLSAINDCVKSAKRVLNHLDENTSDNFNMSSSSDFAKTASEEIEAKGDKATKLLKKIRISLFSSAFIWLIYMVCFYIGRH